MALANSVEYKKRGGKWVVRSVRTGRTVGRHKKENQARIQAEWLNRVALGTGDVLKLFHQSGKHEQKAHGRKGSLRDTHIDGASGKTGRVFESSFPEYSSGARAPFPDEMSESNSSQQRAMLERDVMRDGADYSIEEDDMFSRVEGARDEARDFYDDAPLVHGTSAEGAIEVEREGLQSRKAMMNQTREEVNQMLPFDEREQMLMDLEERGNTFAADKEAGLDEFVFMTHAESAGYGEVDVVIDEAVLNNEGVFATTDDIFGVHSGPMTSHNGDVTSDKGSDFKNSEFPDGVLENYSKQVVNTQHGTSDYEDLAVEKYATTTAAHEIRGIGFTEGTRSMEVKAPKVDPESVIGYYTEHPKAAEKMIDKGVPPGKIVVGVPRGGFDFDTLRDDVRERTVEVPDASGFKAFGQHATGKHNIFREMQSQWDSNFDKPIDQRLDDIDNIEVEAGRVF